jgi:hypothetical protein
VAINGQCRRHHRADLRHADGQAADAPARRVQGSITAIQRAHCTMRSISASNSSRRVRFFIIAYGAGKAALAHGRSGLRFDAFTYARVVPGAAMSLGLHSRVYGA